LKNLIYGVLLFVMGQSMIWFQTNGQFIWPWFKKNPLILSFLGGTTISYMFIKATAFIAGYYDGLIWPGRFIGFSVGILSFALLTNYFLNEGINVKTGISLFLAILLICVQIFWK
jgi:hypothetical protein